MATAYVWDDTLRWSGAVYAPDVPLKERKYLTSNLGYEPPPKWALRRFRKRWHGRALAHCDLQEIGSEKGAYGHIQEVREACEEVWAAAKPIAGVVELGDVDQRLSEELWTCAQLVHQLATLQSETYDTSGAEKVITAQVSERTRHLEQLRDEYRALYADDGADPAVVSDAVREALMRAQTLGERRPIDDAVMWTQSLRSIVTQHVARAEQSE
ncbi:hypothetical protein OG747_52880 (plasmid) [Streptomyces sp. NBC_01384]|uniref:hypothetical protein n=1 Tax=Streptomyces sp. NBC_01384 TaxID=2903847 RepID=UPI002F91A13B